ncbi:hypothetical protein AB1Y20_001607 [Prymnesium parvum]|uniref:Uncharacterized protein n=1 Tax=Prymnesium parvum TaxID=97485 RepID=A0AB34KBU7_PRYPA
MAGEAGGKRREAAADALASALSGGASGAAVSVVLQPFDVLRTRMQADASAGAGEGALRTCRAVVAEGGWRNLWRGSTATVARVGCGAAVHFYTLQLLRELRARQAGGGAWADTAANAAMGGASRACAVTLLCPVTLVKTRMEASGAAASAFGYRSVPHALRSIVRKEGVVALWRGLGPALLTNVPFSTLHYAFYRQFQAMLGSSVGEGAPLNFVAGAGASIIATVCTQPCDVLRTRSMLVLDVRRASVGLFAGIAPRLAKRSLQTATLWTLYEELWAVYLRMRKQA